MPTANIPENTTPIAVSSFRPDRRAMASPRNASPRNTTKTPTLAHTSATRTAAARALWTNAYCSGSRKSGMVLVRDVLRTAGPVAAVCAAQERVVAQDRGVAVGDDAAVHREHAREVRHHAREIVRGDEDRAAVAREIAEKRHELLLRRRIDARRGLIEQQQLGIGREGTREKDALTLPSGQRLDRPTR